MMSLYAGHLDCGTDQGQQSRVTLALGRSSQGLHRQHL